MWGRDAAGESLMRRGYSVAAAVELWFKKEVETLTNDLLSITEVSARTGLQSSALRYYERAGLIRPQARIGGRRHYGEAILQRLAIIGLLQDVGFTISEIRKLVAIRGGREQWRELAEDKLDQIDDHIERVQAARELLVAALSCNCEGFDRCDLVNERRARHGKTVRRMTIVPEPSIGR